MDRKKSDRLGEKTGRKNWITAIRDRKEDGRGNSN